MAATYVTADELRANLGIGTLYDNAVVEEVCQTAENLIKKQLWFNDFPVVSAGISQGKAYVVMSALPSFVYGQTVTITGCGTAYNGSHVITSTYPWTNGSQSFPYFNTFPYNSWNFPRGYSIIQYVPTGSPADENWHQVLPYGKVSGTQYGDATDYSSVPEIREAAMMIAVDVWQARQQSNAGGVSPDFSPSPYRMGNSLLSRVRGLIAPHLSPRGMVG
jgi:hypothetical protein